MSRHTILFNPKIEYVVSTRNGVKFDIVKWVENDPTHYVVLAFPKWGGYSCNCPAYKPCKHIKMVRRFRQKRYAATGYGRVLNSMVFEGD